MPRNGITKELVIQTAVALIEQSGCSDFSMRILAEQLGIKTASLYNHVDSMSALFVEVCSYALHLQCRTEMQAIEGKTGDDAIFALAHAYRNFAKEHKELYRLIMNTAVSCGEELSDVSLCIVEPFLNVLSDSTLSETEKLHWQRVLRGLVHGFISQEDAGFFSHLPANVDDSFHIAIQCYIDGLVKAQRGDCHE